MPKCSDRFRSKVSPTDSELKVESLKNVRPRDVLVELGPGTDSKAKFRDDLRSTLDKTAIVRYVEPKATIEVVDIDELTGLHGAKH